MSKAQLPEVKLLWRQSAHENPRGSQSDSKSSLATQVKLEGPFPVLPEAGYLRLKQIVGDPQATPPVPAIIPVGKSTWWAGVKSGRFPQPVKLGPRTTAWRVEDIRSLIENFDG